MARRKDEVSGGFSALRRDKRLTLEDRKLTVDGMGLDRPPEEFEQRFMERVVDKDPSHEDALMVLGHRYTEHGDYRQGLAVDRTLVRLRPNDPTAHYNLACSLSLLERIDEAAEALARALALGFGPFSHVEEDADLENLRRSPQWRHILEARRKGSPGSD